MNEISKVILDHRSIRNFKNQPIDQAHIDLILKGAIQAPSSVNGQSLSIIELRDSELKAQVIEIASNQTWIENASHFFVFCIDFHKAGLAAKALGKELVMVNQTEAVMVGSIDVGLAMGNAIAIAESLGYGTVPIGAIRNNPREMVRLLKLPQYVFPVAGLVIGFRNEDSAIKPRMPFSMYYHVDGYHKDMVVELKAYDELMSDYMNKRTKGENNRNWSETTVGAFSQLKHPDITPVLKEQGFKLN